jgi:hypothetical protein
MHPGSAQAEPQHRANASLRVRWERIYDRAPPSARWDGPTVDARILEMLKVCGATAGRMGPRLPGNAMPEFAPDDAGQWLREIALLQAGLVSELARDVNARNRTRYLPTIAEVTRAEEALDWPWRYLQALPGLRRVYQVWSFCEATGNSFAQAQRSLSSRGIPGWSNERNVRRARVDAGLVIAIGLMRDGVLRPEDEPLVEDSGDNSPDWWTQVELLAHVEGLEAATRLIGDMVRLEEFGGRSFGNPLTLAEYRGRVTVLVRQLQESMK